MSINTQAGQGDATNELGLALRDLRKERGMTLAEASTLTGLPISTLSKIENNRMSISYDKLVRICQGLSVDIAQLFAGGGPAAAPALAPAAIGGRRSITRAGDGYAIETAHYAHLYPAADLLKKRIVPIVADIRARSLEEFGELIRHSGEEYAYILEGSVDMYTDLYAPTRLEAGDSIYFDSGMAHAYIAASDGVCRLLSICAVDDVSATGPVVPADAAANAAANAAKATNATPTARVKVSPRAKVAKRGKVARKPASRA